MRPLLLFLLCSILFYACKEKKQEEEQIFYDGPSLIVENLAISFSDSGNTKIKMSTAKQLNYENEDQRYPKTVYISFLNKDGVEYSTLRGDSGSYTKKEALYKLKGNVFFYNKDKQQSLESEELLWNPKKKIVYTDQQVKINTPTEQIKGSGMKADQDFSNYTIKKISGILQVDSLITQPKVKTDSVSN